MEMSGLVKYDGGNGFDLAVRVGQAAAEAGQYGSRNAAELALRVQYGLEIGLGPAQSLTAIHVVQGNPSLTAGAIAAKIKGSGRYNYRVTEHTDEACTVVVYENGEEAGTSRFTMDDAKAAGLLANAQWKKYPRNMLFARAVSNAARWYAADVFGGAVYTPDELGATVDPESGEVIDGTVTEHRAPAFDYEAEWQRMVAYCGDESTAKGFVGVTGLKSKTELADEAKRDAVWALMTEAKADAIDAAQEDAEDTDVHPDQVTLDVEAAA